MKKVAIVDGNNFYVSCERIFQPKLRNQPVIVLSNNDGCVISRSDEAKLLGIPMGEPFFQIRELVERENVKVFSSNYALYGDISKRIISILKDFSPVVEVYSIDESFILLDHVSPSQIEAYCRDIRAKILQYIGVPIGIGVSTTKTLAKIANRIAKKVPEFQNYFSLLDTEIHDEWLGKVAVENVWGIGRQTSKLLFCNGIRSAKQLKYIPQGWAKKNFSVTLRKTVDELNGISCIDIDNIQPARKSILCSRSFPKKIRSIDDLSQAAASHAEFVAAKARKQKTVSSAISIFTRGKEEFNNSKEKYYDSITYEFPEPTNLTSVIVASTTRAISAMYNEKILYEKCGVILHDCTPEMHRQMSFFSQIHTEKNFAITKVMDGINQKYGRGTIHVAASGTIDSQKNWTMKSQLRSQEWTTKKSELLKIILPK